MREIKDNQPNWILLRGLGRESQHWGEEFISSLESLLSPAKVMALDCPGNGLRYRESSPLTVGDTVEKVRNAYTKLEGSGPINLLGISLGGMVAMSWAIHYPLEVSSLVVINSSAANVSKLYERIDVRALLNGIKIVTTSNTHQREALILKGVSNDSNAQAKAHAEWVEIHKSHPVSLTNLFRQLLAARAFKLPKNTPSIPALFLNSTKDRFVSHKCTQKLHSRWGGSLKTHDSAGHDLPLDDANWVIEQIRQWREDAK